MTLMAGLAVASIGANASAQDSDRVRETVKRLETVLAQVDARLVNVDTAQTELDASRADNVQTRQQLTVAMTQAQQRGVELATARRDLAAVRSEVAAQALELSDLRRQRDERRLREDELAAKLARLEQSARDEASALHAKLGEANQAAQANGQTIDQLKAKVSASDVALADLRHQLQESSKQLGDAVLERDALRAELEPAHQSAKTSEAAAAQARARAEALADESEQLRAQLEAARSAPSSAPSRARSDEPPVQIHHHGSGNIILQIPARAPRTAADTDESGSAGNDRQRRINE